MNTPLRTEVAAFFKNQQAIELEEFTRSALNPAHSVVVRACAGSGKTWLLTSRIIRLLLEGVEPKHILAITFTKKAAQEMRDRVADLLREMADGTTEQVVLLVTERGLPEATARERIPMAQGLYDHILGSGQDIPIYTFDAWFYRLLKAAPMGSGVSRDATLLLDNDELRQATWDAFYQQFNTAEGLALRTHYLALIDELGEFICLNMLNAALAQGNEIELWHQSLAQPVMAQMRAEISQESGFDVQLGEAGILEAWHRALISGDAGEALNTILTAMFAGKPEKAERAQSIQNALDSGAATKLWAALAPFITQSHTLSKQKFQLDKEQLKRLDGRIDKDIFEDARARVNETFALKAAWEGDLKAYRLHEHIWPCVMALLSIDRAQKRRTNQLEFGDVSRQCFELLHDESTAAFMQTQLDARYKHLLFDEFQDTNPIQWHIIHDWLAAYQGEADKPRVFLVGDVKQSIYRFRGADARLFDQAQALLCTQYDAQVLQTQFTRRNSQAVIDWVNQMFTQPDCALEDFSPHRTAQEGKVAGHIACLGLPALESAESVDEPTEIMAAEQAPPRDWLTQPQYVLEQNIRDDESAQLVAAIEQLVGRYPVWDEKLQAHRPARYSDMMILIYGRTHLVNYERLLRQAHIPFESSRRGGLLDTLEALDLMALVQWLLRADDDWALMQVLRNPMLAATDEQLLQLRSWAQNYEAEGASLSPLSYWQVWQRRLADGSVETAALWHERFALLSQWQAMAGCLPVHDVLDHIYAQGRIFEAYARVVPTWLNPQVQANLQSFLQLALNVNAGRYPSLSDFLYALKRSQARAQDGHSESEPLGMRDAVRILTVHASKGLEAPIVFLIDMKTAKARADVNYWLIDWYPDDAAPAHVSWVSTGERIGLWRAQRRAQAQALDEQEHFNKCYVAMTRARQVLVISAAQELGDTAETPIESAESSHSGKTAATGLFEQLRQALTQLTQLTQLTSSNSAESIVLPDEPHHWGALAPQWLSYMSSAAMSEAVSVGSDAVGEPLGSPEQNAYSDIEASVAHSAAAQPAASVSASDEHSMRLGTALHYALECMTAEYAGRLVDATTLSVQFAIDLSEAQRLCDGCERMLKHPEWQRWFDSSQYDEAYNEMSLMTADGQIKRVDRWVRRGSEISILDYKSGWDALSLLAYERQMRAYVSILREIYPACTVRAYLLRVDGVAHEVCGRSMRRMSDKKKDHRSLMQSC